MDVDYLVVGQGLAGTLLAHQLLERGCRIAILNKETEQIASLKAAGIYNPVTGRKMTLTWMADVLFPTLEERYRRLEKLLGASFFSPMDMYRPFGSVEEQNDWQGKVIIPEYAMFIRSLQAKSLSIPHLHDPFGGIILRSSGYVNLPVLIESSRRFFQERECYFSEEFEEGKMDIQPDSVVYKIWRAKKIIFCEGPQAVRNRWWKFLPFRLVKGEILHVKANLSIDFIVNKGVFMVPKNEEFRVGSTYDHSRLDFEPSESGLNSIREKLHKLYTGDLVETGSSAGIRPATYDRRPFIGLHPEHNKIGIFNGFGTKGVSLSPYFANQFVNFLQGEGTLLPEVDVQRVLM